MKQSLIVFAYDFPNFKTQEILIRLFVEGYPIVAVIGAPRRNLNRPPLTLRDSPSYVGLMETRDICKRFGLHYVVMPHDGPECEAFIKDHPADYAVIAGAQILKPNTVRAFGPDRIINTHEAMLPWVRGIETLKWSIYKDIPMATSIHFIDETIDQGRLIYQEKLELKPDDTMIDISLRFIQIKPETVVKALQILETTPLSSLPQLGGYKVEYCNIMSPDLANSIPTLFPAWLEKYQGPAMPIDPFAEPYATLGKKSPPKL